MRARNIKPGFFQNEYLAELGPYCQLLFEGLWLLADREGRLEDRPKRIKAEIFPYYDIDVNELLDNLCQNKERFIIRYEVDGEKFIWIPNFKIHNNPHPNEKPSIIPAFTGDIVKCNEVVVKNNLMQCTNRAESPLLNPEYMNPESLNHEKVVQPSSSPVPYDEVVKAYNSFCTKLRQVSKITDSRKKAIKARWNQNDSITFYYNYFSQANETPFLTGANDNNWMADFDWLMKENNMAKVLEGKYDDRRTGNSIGSNLRSGSEPIPVARDKPQEIDQEENARMTDKLLKLVANYQLSEEVVSNG